MTQAHYYDPFARPASSNGLGIAGFVCSLAGLLLTGGLLCPIGLILSLFALGREPRGFAIAGVILGLLGTCGWVLLWLVAGVAILAALGIGVAAVALANPEKTELTFDMMRIGIAVQQYRDENKYLPASIDLVHGLDENTLTDPWGGQYRYVMPDANEFDLVSAGEDRKFDTGDDIALSKIGKTWEGANASGLRVHSDEDGGTVRITVGGNEILNVSGDDDGGEVRINVGDRVLEITGDESGGTVQSNPATAPATAETSSSSQPSP